MDTINFEQEEVEGNEEAKTASDLEIEPESTPPKQTNSQQDVNLGEDAITLFEDDKFIFTSEGIVDKTSLRKEQDNSSDAEPAKPDEKILGKFESYDDLVDSYKELEKKLGQNSEAVNKLRELNPVLPMLEAMLGDDTFLEMAENYFTNPEAQSEAFKKQLGIDDDFVFDLNMALSDPKSDDAKVLDKLMKAKQPKAAPQNKTQTNQQISDADKQAFMDKYNMSESDYDDMMQKAQNYKITHDDIYHLINKDKIIAEAKKEAQGSVKKQLETAKNLRKSPSGGGSKNEPSAEDSFMSALQQGKGLFDD